MAAPRQRGRIALDFSTDRAAQFRRARRHTMLVRTMRVLLPVTALVLLAGYGVVMQRTYRIGSDGKISVDSVAISTEALVAHNPRYEGFNKDGGRYTLRSRTAEQDIGQKGPVRLNGIEARLIDANNAVTDLKGVRGSYDTRSGVLELIERIDVESQSGMKARLSQATVLSKDGKIVSREPVVVEMTGGVVHGNDMEMLQKEREVTFSNGVKARLKPEPRGTAAQSQATPGAAQRSAFGNSDEPVDITSATLKVYDLRKVAVFAGNVVAVQGESTLTSHELEVSYEGQPGQASPAAQAGSEGSKIKRIIAKGDVTMTRGVEKATGRLAEFDAETDRAILHGPVTMSAGPDRNATSERADIDNRSDTALLTGNVVVTQARNVLKGSRLLVNRKGGTMQMSAPAGQGAGRGRVQARLYQGDGSAQGQAQTPRKGSAAGQGGAGLNLRSDPDAPIDIEADTLDVDDRSKVAIFRASAQNPVRAVQGGYTIVTEELVAHYAGEAGLALGAPAQGAAAGAAKAQGGGAQLQRVRAPRKVFVRSPDGNTATGNSADFDPKANTVVLAGDVTLTQKENVSTGEKALLDMGTGSMRILNEAGGSRPSFMATPEAFKDRKSAPAPAAAPKAVPQSSGWSSEQTRVQVK